MPLNNLEAAGVFVCEVFYAQKSFVEKEFRSTFQYGATGTPAIADHEQVGQKLSIFISSLLRNDMIVKRYTCSTIERDTDPYNGTEFLTREQQLNGTGNNSGADSLPLNICLYIKKNVDTGRSGKIFLRGVFNENDVLYGHDNHTLGSVPFWQTKVDDAITGSGLSSMFLGPANPTHLLVGDNPFNNVGARYCSGFTVAGVRAVRINKQRRQ